MEKKKSIQQINTKKNGIDKYKMSIPAIKLSTSKENIKITIYATSEEEAKKVYPLGNIVKD